MEKRRIVDIAAGVLLGVGYVYPTHLALIPGLGLLALRHPFIAVFFGFLTDLLFASPEHLVFGYPFMFGTGVVGLCALVGRTYIRTNRGVY